MLRYANSFLWKLEKAANFKSQMEFLLRKPRTFENPISPSACNIFQVSLCIIVMKISLGHILYCLLHNSTPSPKCKDSPYQSARTKFNFFANLSRGKWYSCGILAKAPQREYAAWNFFLKPSAERSFVSGPSPVLVVWLILTHWVWDSSQLSSFLGKCKEGAVLLQIHANK